MEEGQKSDPSLEGGPDGAPRRKEAQEEYTEESHGEVHGEAQEEDSVVSRQGPPIAQPGRGAAIATYIAWAKDSDNYDKLQETRKFLNETVVDKKTPIRILKPIEGRPFLWGSLRLDDAALKKVKEHPNIQHVAVEPKFEEDIAPTSDEEHVDWVAARKLVKRAPGWKKQDPAPKNLALISQPKNTDQKDYKAFVYQEVAGDGTFIYVVDEGVAYNVEYAQGKREFPRGKAFSLQTDESAKSQAPDEDNSERSHGTKVASVAVGQRFGVAKKATLVSVKALLDSIDLLQAIDNIYKDVVFDNPSRVQKTVVVCPWSVENDDKQLLAAFRATFDRLFKMGIPVVMSSGNHRKSSDDINRLPQVLSAPDFPLINAGGSTINGERVDTSQGGPKLTVHAPGIDVEVSNKDGIKAVAKGTSFAAPAVAGVIATYMSRATVPWRDNDKGYERVSAIRDYIKSDASSDVRNPFADEPIRIIWNGATFQDHVDAKPQSTSFKPGTCKVSLSNYQEAYVSGFITYGWQGLISDDAGAPIPSCSTQKQVTAAATNYGIPCSPLGNRLDVHAVGKDSVEFKMGNQTWRSGDKNCVVQDWTQDGTSITPVRKFDCTFKC